MTNREAIKSMRNLDDLISITESEHESVKTAISALEHNSTLIEHISNLQNENTDFFNKLVESEKENTKLKSEIEQFSNELISVRIENELLKKKNELTIHYFEQYSPAIDEIEKLKEELEQSVKLPCKVGNTIYLLDFEENRYDEATVEEFVFTRDGKIEINSDYEVGTWSEDEYVKYSREEAEQSLKDILNS